VMADPVLNPNQSDMSVTVGPERAAHPVIGDTVSQWTTNSAETFDDPNDLVSPVAELD